ncbi:MAG: RagB/SusD family nutrient uptake outer membrane protein [Saprospiraceae bacterium]|nr:RagB/SusD family nutrient uptake outer membrane protein [Saprospiraceae bacterium]MDP4819760.1 RagB/SusD family nutrient uptake outer membrane protein [Saprospiraceae bacterium]MDP4998502.1 RagB/SusD family nutrient uptake outer membrane protein [Saprospiraceae bacterium]
MNKFKYILLSSLLVLGTACDEFLDVEPEQSLSTPVAFSDKSTALASLMGVYSQAQDADVYGSVTAMISEMQADNVRFVGSFPTFQEISRYVTIASNGSVRSIWADHYAGILAANAVIKNMPSVEDPGLSESERAQFIGEAKFMRALFYFNLVNMFAQPYNVSNGATPGVPLVLEPTIFEGEQILPARNTVAEVYAQIEKDFQEALAVLPDKYGSAAQTRGRATKGAANGLLSRLYLYKGDNVKAIQSADAVLGKTDLYALAADYSFYDGNTAEDVFSIQNTTTDQSSWDLYYLPAVRGGRGDAPYSDDLLAVFDQTNDARFTSLTFTGVDAAGNQAIFTNKFKNGIENSDNGPIMRTTEVVLNKAEALVKSTNSVNAEAIALINPLLTRAGVPTVSASDFASAEALLDRILLERRKELCFEGHRRMDLLRNGKALRTAGPGAGVSNPGDPLIVLPIPQRDIDLGSSLPQNPGY